MQSTRQLRVAETLRQKLSELFLLEMNDPRLSGVTITEVQIDRELSYADVYVNALGDEDRQDEVLAALARAAGFMRHRLSQSIDLRKMPELRFKWDSAFKYAQHIDRLLDSIEKPSDSEENEQGDADAN